MSKTRKVRNVIGKCGWVSFAIFLVANICGQDEIATMSGAATVGCAVVVNGMKAADEIQDIVNA